MALYHGLASEGRQRYTKIQENPKNTQEKKKFQILCSQNFEEISNKYSISGVESFVS
jgi:hypothetical protein